MMNFMLAKLSCWSQIVRINDILFDHELSSFYMALAWSMSKMV